MFTGSGSLLNLTGYTPLKGLQTRKLGDILMHLIDCRPRLWKLHYAYLESFIDDIIDRNKWLRMNFLFSLDQ